MTTGNITGDKIIKTGIPSTNNPKIKTKIKIKDNYFYDKTTGFILDQDGSGYSVELSNPLKITATKI